MATITALLVAATGCSQPHREPVVRTPTASPSAAATPSASTVPDAAITYLIECPGGDPLNEPPSVVVACADGNEMLDGLRWTGWGSPAAKASGSMLSNDCEPNCAQGKMIDHPIDVVADGLRHLESTQIYTRLTVTFRGERPYGADPVMVIDLPG